MPGARGSRPIGWLGAEVPREPSVPARAPHLDPKGDALQNLRAAALSGTPISLGARRTSSLHEFYRYPGRFSPDFAGAAIAAFTNEGELVIDPFVGGGTTAIEACLGRRRSIVSDLNPLATFVTRIKTRPLAASSQDAVKRWIALLPQATRLSSWTPPPDIWTDQGYLKGIDTRLTWRITKLIRLALASIDSSDEAAADFCRCVVLLTAQWALDMRSSIPSVGEFRSALARHGIAMLEIASSFANRVKQPSFLPVVMDQGLPGLAERLRLSETDRPALILTSPPYPGVYVNYHRWKLQGRKEIRAPYWITNQLDGHGLAYYTMHARAEPTLRTYFDRLRTAFEDLAAIAGPTTTIVQLVGFNNPPEQLSRYLRTMIDVGFEEILLPELATGDDGRLWRSVPSRRWWAEVQSRRSIVPHTAQEAVLIHRLKP